MCINNKKCNVCAAGYKNVAFAIKRPKERAAMDVTEETERLTKIVDYTNEHYKENITIAEICRYIKFWKAMALKIINYFGECFMTGIMVKRRSWLMKEGHALFLPKMLYEIDKAKDCITLVMPTKDVIYRVSCWQMTLILIETR